MKLKPAKRLLAIPLVLALFGLTSATCTARDLAVPDCVDSTTRPTPIQGPATTSPPSRWQINTQNVPDNSPLDLRGRTYGKGSYGFYLRSDTDPTPPTVGACVVGGTLRSEFNHLTTVWDTWHDIYSAIIQAPSTSVIGTTIRNTGDGITFSSADATNWRAIGIRADGGTAHPEGAYIHDDCVENDMMNSGQILDSKFDGCHVFLSAIHNWGTNRPDGTGNTVLVSDTLVRLQAMENSFCPVITTENGCNNAYGYWQHGGFFKWAYNDAGDTTYPDGTPPALVLKRSMFRADQAAAYGGNQGGRLGVPPGTTCDDVVVVGWDILNSTEKASWNACAAAGPPVGEDGIPNLQQGTIADWNAAVAAWDEAHPPLDAP